MAVVTTKSAGITNLDASPIVANTKAEGAAFREKSIDSYVAAANGDSSTSKFIFFRVPTFIIVKSLILYSAALGGSAASDFGVYYADDARYVGAGVTAGAVVDADFFGSAVSLVSAVNGTEISHESGVYEIAERFQPLWQALDLTSDPGGAFDIVATLTADTAAAGNVYLRMVYAE